jgi:hypothetical protein
MMVEMSQRGLFAMKRTYVAVGLSILIVGTFFHQQSRLTELELEMRMRDHMWAKVPTMAAPLSTMASAASASGVEVLFAKAVPLPSVPTTAEEEEALEGERGLYGGTNDKAHLGGPDRDTSRPGVGVTEFRCGAQDSPKWTSRPCHHVSGARCCKTSRYVLIPPTPWAHGFRQPKLIIWEFMSPPAVRPRRGGQ